MPTMEPVRNVSGCTPSPTAEEILPDGGKSAESPSVGEPNSLFLKGYAIQGRSIKEIRVRERLPESDWKDIEKAEASSERGWEDKGWESIVKRGENLVWIKGNTFYKEVLDDWKEERKALDAKIEASKKSQGEVTNELYNLVGFFSVFQGVILTAVSQLTQTSSLHPKPLCGKVWFPIVLSVLGALAAIVGILLKHRDLRTCELDIHANRQLQTVARIRGEELKKKGENFFFGGDRDEDRDERDRKKAKEDKIRPLKSNLLLKSSLIVGLVVVITLFFILSYFVIMCDKWVIKGWH